MVLVALPSLPIIVAVRLSLICALVFSAIINFSCESAQALAASIGLVKSGSFGLSSSICFSSDFLNFLFLLTDWHGSYSLNWLMLMDYNTWDFKDKGKALLLIVRVAN